MSTSLDIADRNLDHLVPPLHARVVSLLQRMEAHGHPIFVTEGKRSRERQAWLYASGRTRHVNTDGTPALIVTHAPPGSGWHETGRAADLAFVPRFKGDSPWADSHPWNQLGAEARSLGLEWGGDWPKLKRDRPHVQFTEGLTIAQALAQQEDVT